MKMLTGVMAITLILGFLVVPSVLAEENDSNTDPNLDNNQANVTVTPYSELPAVTSTTEKTIPMQKTGTPIAGLLTAALMIFSGMGLSKREFEN